MTKSKGSNQVRDFQEDMQWMRHCLQVRLRNYIGGKSEALPKCPKTSACREILSHELGHQATDAELLLFLLALSPHYQAESLDNIFQQYLDNRGDFPQLGGVRGKKFRGFLPTGETAMFLIAGNFPVARKEVYNMLSAGHPFHDRQLLWLGEVPDGEPLMSAPIIVRHEFVERSLYQIDYLPRFSMKFPAKHLSTMLTWSDLILDPSTLAGVREIANWLKIRDQIKSDKVLGKRVKPGYRALFHGPPGTGKTLTATILGQRTSQPVFRVDLSMVVSKYIGETEKNLAQLFSKAENKNWILFFDEADSLFGKRTSVRDAHDRYANQEVSYLLQRIEDFNGLVILASNLKGNIDKAFARRFQSIVHFPMPNPSQRLQLWKQTMSPDLPFANEVDIMQLAREYELSGAEIVNILLYAYLETTAGGKKEIPLQTILNGIRREFRKAGRVS